MNEQNTPPTPQRTTSFIFPILLIIISIAIGAFGYRFVSRYQGELTLLQQARAIVESNTILDIPDKPTLEYGMIRGDAGRVERPLHLFRRTGCPRG